MNIDSFDRLYIFELKNAYSTEKKLTGCLSKMEEACSNTELKQAFRTHREETENHVKHLETIFENLEMSPSGETCKAVEGLVQDAKQIIDDDSIPADVKDAAIIAAAQKCEHYEIAVYGTLCYFASILGRDEDERLLNQILEEEKQADKLLNDIAINQVNVEAMEETTEQVEVSGEEPRPSM